MFTSFVLVPLPLTGKVDIQPFLDELEGLLVLRSLEKLHCRPPEWSITLNLFGDVANKPCEFQHRAFSPRRPLLKIELATLWSFSMLTVSLYCSILLMYWRWPKAVSHRQVSLQAPATASIYIQDFSPITGQSCTGWTKQHKEYNIDSGIINTKGPIYLE